MFADLGTFDPTSVTDLTANQISNQDVSDSVFNTDTTLNNPDATSNDSSISDVISQVIGAAPGLILLSRTPQSKLPSVAAVQNPVTGGTSIVSAQKPSVINWNLILLLVILIVAIGVIGKLFEKK